MYYVYIIQCTDGSLYTGITTDVERRFSEHRQKKGGHYTASHEVKKVIYIEQVATKNEALRREAEIKSWRRKRKLSLTVASGQFDT